MSIHRPETAPAPVPTTAPEPKRRLIPRPVRDAIELIATGRAKTIEAAAQRIGWERSRLSKWLSRPECIAAAKERAAKAVAVGALRSGARLGELVESESAKVAMEATKFSLQAAGIGPATAAPVNVNVEVRAGWVIDLSEPDRPMKIVTGEAKPIESAGSVIDAKPGE